MSGLFPIASTFTEWKYLSTCFPPLGEMQPTTNDPTNMAEPSSTSLSPNPTILSLQQVTSKAQPQCNKNQNQNCQQGFMTSQFQGRCDDLSKIQVGPD